MIRGTARIPRQRAEKRHTGSGMSRTGSILTPDQRRALPAIMRVRKAGALKVRRANAPVAPGDGRSVR